MAALFRPTQQRARAPSVAPGLLLCREAGVSRCAPARRGWRAPAGRVPDGGDDDPSASRALGGGRRPAGVVRQRRALLQLSRPQREELISSRAKFSFGAAATDFVSDSERARAGSSVIARGRAGNVPSAPRAHGLVLRQHQRRRLAVRGEVIVPEQRHLLPQRLARQDHLVEPQKLVVAELVDRIERETVGQRRPPAVARRAPGRDQPREGGRLAAPLPAPDLARPAPNPARHRSLRTWASVQPTRDARDAQPSRATLITTAPCASNTALTVSMRLDRPGACRRRPETGRARDQASCRSRCRTPRRPPDDVAGVGAVLRRRLPRAIHACEPPCGGARNRRAPLKRRTRRAGRPRDSRPNRDRNGRVAGGVPRTVCYKVRRLAGVCSGSTAPRGKD
jgi:hypothetical protein